MRSVDKLDVAKHAHQSPGVCAGNLAEVGEGDLRILGQYRELGRSENVEAWCAKDILAFTCRIRGREAKKRWEEKVIDSTIAVASKYAGRNRRA